MKIYFILIFLLAAVGFSCSQEDSSDKMHNKDMEVKVKGTALPEGWEMRLDKPNASPEDVKFVKEMKSSKVAYHFTTGPAAIYYNPKDSLKDQYTVEASFIQVKPSHHPEAYGIFFAGKNLQEDDQHYIYFLVRQDGKYLIKERNGKDTKKIIDWTSNDAVKSLNDNGQVTNLLSVKVDKTNVTFSVNGKKVASLDKSKLGNTNGQVGLRINHNLNVKASGFKAVQL